MQCWYCQKEIETEKEEFRYCPFCGVPLGEVVEGVSQKGFFSGKVRTKTGKEISVRIQEGVSCWFCWPSEPEASL